MSDLVCTRSPFLAAASLIVVIVLSSLLLSLLLSGPVRADTQQQVNLFENSDTLTQLLGTTLGCELSKELTIDLLANPLYSNDGGDCVAVGHTSLQNRDYFADAQCQQAVTFQNTPPQVFCSTALDKETLGDASGLPESSSVWTLNPGNRYDLGAASLAGFTQPYMQRVTYKQVQTAAGMCELEMRIYKNNLAESGQKSMLALHGGSWRARGFGFFGLEMSVPRFTDQGFVVFAPFYRLLDNKEGPAACNGASILEVVEDATDALQWVVDHAADFGAMDYPTLFGQSAGAHLAASVSVNKPDSVANTILYYPPTDFTEFALRVQDGSYTNEEGLGILEVVMGGDASTIDISASPVPENTLPPKVESDPDFFPPMFFLHGLADELVVATQSTRLCGALGGNIDAARDRDFWIQRPDLRSIVDCDQRGSEMHLIKEGDHALDVCPSSNVLLQDLCLSGSAASRVLVADSMASSARWASEIADQRLAERAGSAGTVESGSPQPTDSTPLENVTEADPESGGGSGGGGLVLWLLLALAGLTVFRFSSDFSLHREFSSNR